MSRKPPETTESPDAPPPLLGSWRNLYWAVALSQAALIALFYGLTRVFG